MSTYEDVEVTVTSLMNIEVQDGETLEQAVERVVKNMNPERAQSFVQDCMRLKTGTGTTHSYSENAP